jgi:hypothetical protein
LVHGDLCGPISPITPSGKQYFLLLVDDCSGYMWLHLLTAKSDDAAVIQRYKALVKDCDWTASAGAPNRPRW